MKQTHTTNDALHDARFMQAHLARYHGDAKAAMRAARELEQQGEHGKAWWQYVAAQCVVQHADTLIRRQR